MQVGQPMKRDKKMTKVVYDRYQSARNRKSELHDDWYTQHAFYDGRQYVRYRGGKPSKRKAPTYRVRLTKNLIRPIVDTAVAKLNQQKPGWMVRPTGPEEDRIHKARAAERLLEFLYRKLKLRNITQGTLFWAAVTGTGFAHVNWDKSKTLTKGKVTGAPLVKVVTPFDVYPDPAATSMDDARWCIVKHSLSAADMEANWKGSITRIQAAAESANEDAWFDADIKGYISGGTVSEGEETYEVLEYEEAPCAEYPKGRKIYQCGLITLASGELPNGRYSLHMVRVGVAGGRFWGLGIVRDVMDAQREYNRTFSHIIELRNLAVNPPWIAPNGSLKTGRVSNRPDSINFYNQNYNKPERLPPVPIPSGLYELAQSLRQSIADISGVHDVSQGRQPSGVVSGRAMGILSDQDATKLGPAVSQLELWIESLGQCILEMCQEHLDPDVTLSIVGEARSAEVTKFHRGMLDSELDVEVQPGSMLPKSLSFEREMAQREFQIGALGPPDDPQTLIKYRRALGLGLTDHNADEEVGRLYARRENVLLEDEDEANREKVRVSWLDQHIVHIDEHLRACRDPAFSELDPEVQIAHEQHIAEHYRQLHMQAQGLPTYVAAFGEDPSAQQQPEQPQQPMPEAMPPEQPMPEDAMGGGLVGGGTPEMNEALVEGGPGVSPYGEEMSAYG
tara:strand:+ start:9479 stop:11506 length:2028 start_codon:yes stop_codon:yes gene_type:complete